MDKSTKKIVAVLFIIALLSSYLTRVYDENYYKDMYETERKNAEIAYYQAIFERDTYARMYYKSIGNEEMAKTFERSNTFEREKECYD